MILNYIEDAITDYYLEHPTEKDLRAIMTSNSNIMIKAAKKDETVTAKQDKTDEN